MASSPAAAVIDHTTPVTTADHAANHRVEHTTEPPPEPLVALLTDARTERLTEPAGEQPWTVMPQAERGPEDLTAVHDALAALGTAELKALAAMLGRGNRVTVSSLAAAAATLADPRDPRGVRHPLILIVVLVACAVLAGKNTWAGIARYAAVRGRAIRAALAAEGWIPAAPGAGHASSGAGARRPERPGGAK